MTLMEGRFFEDQDRRGSAPVVIVDEVLANRYWKGESALGKTIGWGETQPQAPWVPRTKSVPWETIQAQEDAYLKSKGWL